jgi:hypothetical protein
MKLAAKEPLFSISLMRGVQQFPFGMTKNGHLLGLQQAILPFNTLKLPALTAS